MKKLLLLSLLLLPQIAKADEFVGTIKESEGRNYLIVLSHVVAGMNTQKRDSVNREFQLRIKEGATTKPLTVSDYASAATLLSEGTRVKLEGEPMRENNIDYILISNINSLTLASSAAETISIPEIDPFDVDGVKMYTEKADPNIGGKK